MTQEWKVSLMEQLRAKIGEITQENVLTTNSDQSQTLKSLFKIYPDKESGVLAQALLFETLPGLAQLEINFVMDVDVDPACYGELERAMIEMNYYLPLGAAGIEYPMNKMALRYVMLLDEKKSIAVLAQEIIKTYELLMGSLRIVYPAFSQICVGNMTYEEAVEKQLLLKQ